MNPKDYLMNLFRRVREVLSDERESAQKAKADEEVAAAMKRFEAAMNDLASKDEDRAA